MELFKRYHSSIKTTPQKYVHFISSQKYPWEILNASSFNYEENKKNIERKLNVLKKNFPLLSPVQIVENKSIFGKKSHMPGFSKEIFYIYLIKRPILANETFLFKLIDASGKILSQSFSIFDIKKSVFQSPDKFSIDKIISKVKKNGKMFFNVKISQFPKSMVFKIEENQLKNFKIDV